MRRDCLLPVNCCCGIAGCLVAEIRIDHLSRFDMLNAWAEERVWTTMTEGGQGSLRGDWLDSAGAEVYLCCAFCCSLLFFVTVKMWFYPSLRQAALAQMQDALITD